MGEAVEKASERTLRIAARKKRPAQKRTRARR